MSSSLKIIGNTMAEALARAQQVFGGDAFIVEAEEKNNQYILTIASSDNITNEESTITSNAQDVSLIKETSFQAHVFRTNEALSLFQIENPLDVVRIIQRLGQVYTLSQTLCETWTRLCLEGTHPYQLDLALERLVGFNSIPASANLIVVGPPGSGKSVVLAKIAAHFLSQKHHLHFVTLDTWKAGAIAQAETYANMMRIPFYVGFEALAQNRLENTLTLIDTPGLNIYKQEDQDFLFQLNEKVQGTLLLVLPSDFHPQEAATLAKHFRFFQTTHLFITRSDVANCISVALNASFSGKLTICGGTRSALLQEGLFKLSAKDLLHFSHLKGISESLKQAS